MTLIETFEQQLIRYWSQLESRKTWKEWIQWLRNAGYPHDVPGLKKGSVDEQVNYQTFLREGEPFLRASPEWFKQLSSPEWLHSQNLVIIPSTKSAQAGSSAIENLETQIKYLKNELQKLQQRTARLEAHMASYGPSPSVNMDSGEFPSVEKYAHGLMATSPTIPLNQAQIMDKELTLRRLTQKPRKEVEFAEENFKVVLERLENVYLSMNDWCSHFAKAGLNLQQLSSTPLEVAGSHQISFRQFGHRIARKIENQEALAQFLKRFEDRFKDGINPHLHPSSTTPIFSGSSTSFSSDNNLPSSSGFSQPSEEMYQDFNSWLEWLRSQGIDPQRYTAQDLKVSGSHRISFTQFCKRIERNLEDIDGFRQALGMTS
ncbi:hypothetical protein WDW89_15335 [Deltaproteobacteria bacterium TL4]